MKKYEKPFLIWITGLSGSGKTLLANSIYKKIKKKNKNTILINGDDLREIFNLNLYDKKSRYNIALSYHKFILFLISQNISVVFATVSMFSRIRSLNRRKIDNYFEIYIESDVNFIRSLNKKEIYKNNNDLWGIKIKPELPKKYDFLVKNYSKDINFDKITTKIIKKFYSSL